MQVPLQQQLHCDWETEQVGDEPAAIGVCRDVFVGGFYLLHAPFLLPLERIPHTVLEVVVHIFADGRLGVVVH